MPGGQVSWEEEPCPSALIAWHWFTGGRTAESRQAHQEKRGSFLLSGTGHLSLPLAALPFGGRGSLDGRRVFWNHLPILSPKKKSPEVCGCHWAF